MNKLKSENARLCLRADRASDVDAASAKTTAAAAAAEATAVLAAAAAFAALAAATLAAASHVPALSRRLGTSVSARASRLARLGSRVSARARASRLVCLSRSWLVCVWSLSRLGSRVSRLSMARICASFSFFRAESAHLYLMLSRNLSHIFAILLSCIYLGALSRTIWPHTT